MAPILAGTLVAALTVALAVGAGYALAASHKAANRATNYAVASSKKAAVHKKSSHAHRLARMSHSRVADTSTERGTATSSFKLVTTEGGQLTRMKPTRQRLVVRGSGPIESMVQAGSPGLRRLTVDASHTVLSSVVLKASVPTVVQRRRPSGGRVVALTFDDGPHPTQTLQILAILQKEHIKATFFMVGRMARYHPAAARAVARAGMLIGDHTENHADLPRLSDARVTREIARGQESIRAVTGVTTRWFRSPYGDASAQAQRTAGLLGMKVVTWSVDTNDWQNPGAAAITRYADKHVRPGSIVLMHDGGGSNRKNTIEALPGVIHELKKRGYRFVTLDQL